MPITIHLVQDIFTCLDLILLVKITFLKKKNKFGNALKFNKTGNTIECCYLKVHDISEQI